MANITQYETTGKPEPLGAENPGELIWFLFLQSCPGQEIIWPGEKPWLYEIQTQKRSAFGLPDLRSKYYVEILTTSFKTCASHAVYSSIHTKIIPSNPILIFMAYEYEKQRFLRILRKNPLLLLLF